ncbi:MAG TPA: sulfatase [Planctomycetota bacterium]
MLARAGTARLHVALAALVAACGQSPRPTSILLVTLDTTRADRIGCYGRAEAGTPALDALAERGVRFERAVTPVPITLPAHASLLSGTQPPHHGLRDNGIAALDEGVVTLAEVARDGGLATAAFVSAFPLARTFGLAQGFERYDDEFAPAGPGAIRERRGDETVRRARAWLEALAPGEPFFLWVHLFDAHEPYRAPEEFARRFPEDPYQAEVAFADHCLGELLGALASLGREGDTLVCVTADHGEGLGEHGEDTHALLLYDTTVRVPLVLAGPGLAPRAVSAPASLTDVAATLAEGAGLARGAALAGQGARSFWPHLAGGPAPEGPLYLETLFPRLHFGWSELVGLEEGGRKYVEAPGARDEAGTARAELFAPADDPAELRDLAAELHAERESLARALEALRRALEQGAAASTRRTQSAEDLEALAALGYGGADVLAELPSAFDAPAPGRDPRRTVGAVQLLNQVRGLSGAGQLEAAAAALARLEVLDPGEVIVHEARGDHHLARGRRGARAGFERAAEEFAAACALEPGRRGLWLRRFEALEALGRLTEALECLDRALALAPPTPEFQRARDELARRVAAGGG